MTEREMLDLERMITKTVRKVIREELVAPAYETTQLVKKYGDTVSNKEAANILGCAPSTARRMVKRGELTGSNRYISTASIARLLCGS